jgi:hypothetical protein
MATGTEARLHELGIVLPRLPTPGGNYLSTKTVGHLVHLAGVISTSAEGVTSYLPRRTEISLPRSLRVQ